MPGNFVDQGKKHKSRIGAAAWKPSCPAVRGGRELQRRFVLKQLDWQTAMPNVPYTITMANGEVIEGVTDAEGATQLLQKDAMNIAKVDMKHTKSPASAVAGIAAAVGAAVAVGKLLSGPDAEAGRALSEGEISLAKGVFGDSIDYSTVRLRDEGLCPLAGQGLRDGAERPHLLRRGVARRGGLEPGEPAAPGSVHSRNDPCLAAPAWRERPLLVGAYQQARQFLLGDQYAYRLEPGKTLKDYNIEQQGDIVRDYFLEKNEFREASANSRFAGVLKNFPTGY